MGSMVNRTSYNAPNVNVDTSGPGIVGGLDGIDPFFMNMAKRRASLAAQRAAMENLAMKRSLEPQYRSDATPTQLQRAQEADAIDELNYKKALREADLNPKKSLQGVGFNMTPGMMEDTTLLPVSMRPKSSSFAPSEEKSGSLTMPSKGGNGSFAVTGGGDNGTGADFERRMLLSHEDIPGDSGGAFVPEADTPDFGDVTGGSSSSAKGDGLMHDNANFSPTDKMLHPGENPNAKRLREKRLAQQKMFGTSPFGQGNQFFNSAAGGGQG